MTNIKYILVILNIIFFCISAITRFRSLYSTCTSCLDLSPIDLQGLVFTSPTGSNVKFPGES